MSKRFATLPAKGAPKLEPINWGDPGDHRNRGKGEAMAPSTDAKHAKRLPEFRPQVPACSAKATASASAPSKAAAPAKPKAPVKSAAAIAAEAANARIIQVMDSPASTGKKKAATRMLHLSKASASEIITKLKSVELDAVQEAKEIEAGWKRAASTVNRIAGFSDEASGPVSAVATGWAKAVAKVNAMNGYAS